MLKQWDQQQMPWKKGQSGNPRGRRPVVPEIRDFCKVKSVKQFAELDRRFYSEDCPDWVEHKIAQLFAAYGYGHPISQAAVHLLDHRRDDSDGQEVSIEIRPGRDEDGKLGKLVDLDTFAAQSPAPKPAPLARLEDLRPNVLQSKLATNERTLEQVQTENERLRAQLADRSADIESLAGQGGVWTLR